MYILGLNAFHWDSSACLLKDGELVAASEEERFNRIKHWSGLPVSAIDFCLKSANISISDVDHITTGHDPRAKRNEKIIYGITHLISLDFIRRRLKRTNQVKDMVEMIGNHFTVARGDIKAQFHHIEHHRSHLGSAFFASPFNESAVLSLDAFGDFTSTMRGVGRDNRISIIDSVSYPHSVGMFYTALTQFLGFHEVGDEYKVMGLAPYGVPHYVDKLRSMVELKADGKFQLKAKYFSYFRKGVVMEMRNDRPYISILFTNELIKLLGKARVKTEEISQYHKDLAASVQQFTEEIIFHIATDLRKKTKLPYLSLAGGVAQNSVANGKIADASGFEQIYIPPAGHDAGLSIGSALYLHNQVLKQPRNSPMLSAYTGSSYTNQQIAEELKSRNISFVHMDDEQLFNTVAEKLTQECVVGWFNGKAEFGPRALGARSILADPRNAHAKELLNSKIKRRESFRPFAPSVLKEYAEDYFDMNDEAPFMEKVFPVKMEKRSAIPAVTHVDGSGRLQTVDAHISSRYYGLIQAFYQRTGIPILLNTSFNENEPIVNSPKEAIECYLRTNMDVLVLENCVVIR